MPNRTARQAPTDLGRFVALPCNGTPTGCSGPDAHVRVVAQPPERSFQRLAGRNSVGTGQLEAEAPGTRLRIRQTARGCLTSSTQYRQDLGGWRHEAVGVDVRLRRHLEQHCRRHAKSVRPWRRQALARQVAANEGTRDRWTCSRSSLAVAVIRPRLAWEAQRRTVLHPLEYAALLTAARRDSASSHALAWPGWHAGSCASAKPAQRT